jgi:hypothetical protein
MRMMSLIRTVSQFQWLCLASVLELQHDGFSFRDYVSAPPAQGRKVCGLDPFTYSVLFHHQSTYLMRRQVDFLHLNHGCRFSHTAPLEAGQSICCCAVSEYPQNCFVFVVRIGTVFLIVNCKASGIATDVRWPRIPGCLGHGYSCYGIEKLAVLCLLLTKLEM